MLDDADRAHFDGLLRYLDALAVPYVVDPTLVRGLDYYTRTLFEVKATSADLGAQNAICGGGRYDNMVKSLGGPDVPAIGFAMGLERLLLAMPEVPASPPRTVALLPLTPRGGEEALRMARDLRALGVRCEVDGRGGKLKAMLSRAERKGAALCVLLGEEIERGVVAVKDLAARSQVEMPLADAARTIAANGTQAPTTPGDAGNDGATSEPRGRV